MGIVMYVLLYLECSACLLHLHAEHNVQVLCLGQRFGVEVSILRVVIVLHEVARVVPIAVLHAGLHESLVHVFLHKIFSCEVNHRARVAGLVYNKQRGYARILRHLGVIGTKGGSDVHDARTVVSRHIVTGDDAESVL